MLSGKLYNNMIRQELYAKVFIPSSQLLTLFTTPITLVLGQVGIFYIPKEVHFFKEAGTAYTLNASSAIGLYHTSVAGTAIGTVNPVGFMDQAGALSAFCNAPAALTVPFGSFTAAQITAANNAPLVIANAVANMTVGTGGLFVSVLYEQWPMVVAFN
jgi:hypothetical protein